jgi:hypothetical protein
MKRIRHAALSALASGALIAGCLVFAPAANAAEIAPAGPQGPTTQLQHITPEQLDQAIDEAKDSGYVTAQVEGRDGSRTTTLDLGQGFVFEVTEEGSREARLGAGSDSYGAYVSFNATDQNVILTGAGFGLSAGICVLSAGTFCVVAGAIITAAFLAITSNGGIRCGTKRLRVYPFSGHNPRCA